MSSKNPFCHLEPKKEEIQPRKISKGVTCCYLTNTEGMPTPFFVSFILIKII